MFHDQGSNDLWYRPEAFTPTGNGRFGLTITESLGKQWENEIVSWPLPEALGDGPVEVMDEGRLQASQISDDRLHVLVDSLAPSETRNWTVSRAAVAPPAATPGIVVEREASSLILGNGVIAIRIPCELVDPCPGPVLAVRRGEGPWLGAGRLETRSPVTGLTARVLEQGALWTAIRVAYAIGTVGSYEVTIRLRPGASYAEIHEVSSLPVRLWPAPRPYREIGTLGASHWDRPLDTVGAPCTRPCPTTNFVLDLRPGWSPDRLQTHSTAAWEIMDLPLRSPTLKTHTAMRAAYPGIDAGWLAVYDSTADVALGVASIDLAHWRMPDDTVHPVHRTPGANAEVVLVDDSSTSHLRFPIENIDRRWLLALTPRYPHAPAQAGKPLRLEADPAYPLWELRTRLGDLSLDKTKEWVTAWPDLGLAHPRVLCTREDFPGIAERIHGVPELAALWEESRDWRPADRYIVEGATSSLAEIDRITRASALIASTLERGYLGPNYAIGLTRPLRRYALACDILWESFSVDEQRQARRLLALAAYIMTDGDWWQYAFRDQETTYLPNFNTDVYTCAGHIGLVLADHPCADVWVKACLDRLEIEFDRHLRLDGCGEENLGSYYVSTWMQLYMPIIWAMQHTGHRDYSADPRIHAGARFLLNVLTPPDPRDELRRQTPPIGHHPNACKSFPIMAQLASFVRDADPQLAAELMWGWRVTGGFVGNLYDHSGPQANALTRHYIFHDETIEPVAPVLRSCVLPQVGALFRSHDGTPFSSFLILKAGRVHSHHDEDEGSIHYYGRGVPLVLDGLRLANGASVHEHNVVSFDRYGQPSGRIECFVTGNVGDYLRARMAPRAFSCDAMYLEETHRSGFVRELVLVKAPEAGGIEYLVVKDTCTGPDTPRWNLDILSREPSRVAGNHLWFPGHPEFGMGLDVIFAEPGGSAIGIEPGPISADLLTPEGRASRNAHWVAYEVREHWLLHASGRPGETFLAILFPRRPDEAPPAVTYLAREEVLHVRHDAGQDLIYLRPNPAIAISLDGICFQGRAGLVRDRGGSREHIGFDAQQLHLLSESTPPIHKIGHATAATSGRPLR